MPSRPSSRFIGYPIDRMLVVFGDAASAAEAAAALRGLGIPDRDIAILRGDEGAARLDGTGVANGYGRFATEELERWHGREPDIENLMRR